MKNVIYRGTLTLNKLKELYEEFFPQKGTTSQYSPHDNDKTISITQQEDGNWIGEAKKYGKVVSVRTNDPQGALLMLLTHPGEK